MMEEMERKFPPLEATVLFALNKVCLEQEIIDYPTFRRIQEGLEGKGWNQDEAL